MYISSIYIKNFRNFVSLHVPVKSGLTCIVGENNTGKTNLLHALRLVIDGNISAYQRRLSETDFSSGVDPSQANHILIAIEFSDFVADVNQEAMLHGCQSDAVGEKAIIAYRFRPGRKARIDIENEVRNPESLIIDDYEWEIRGGTSGLALDTIEWDTEFGTDFTGFSHLQQSYLVIFMKALRDVESDLRQTRFSPLTQLMNDEDISEEERTALVEILKAANTAIDGHDLIKKVGAEIEETFAETAGEAHAMSVRLGMSSPRFADLKRHLCVLLSNDAIEEFSTDRNGLGLNNILYMAMILRHFQRRIEQGRSAGQLLLIEEPEAHLHPQLQRVLMNTLKAKRVQVFVTTHSTHVGSEQALDNLLILTNDGTPATSAVSPAAQIPLEAKEKADIERYLDATRATLLFARRVLLVEGPAELFLIAPLVNKVMNIDLDSKGVSVIPIFGRHFRSYAKLFGPDGLHKRCAILADGDRAEDLPNDAEIEVENDELTELENVYVKAFVCENTFEKDLAGVGRLEMITLALDEVGSTGRAAKLRAAADRVKNNESVDWPAIKQTVLNAANEVGKGRFAQVLSKHVDKAQTIPDYIKEAVEWLVGTKE